MSAVSLLYDCLMTEIGSHFLGSFFLIRLEDSYSLLVELLGKNISHSFPFFFLCIIFVCTSNTYGKIWCGVFLQFLSGTFNSKFWVVMYLIKYCQWLLCSLFGLVGNGKWSWLCLYGAFTKYTSLGMEVPSKVVMSVTVIACRYNLHRELR